VIGWAGEFVHDLSKPVGMRQKLVDTRKQTAWGWAAQTSLEAGMRATYDFYLEHFKP
jgi:GDP-L-fucose synthase